MWPSWQFLNDQHSIGVTLERSNIFQLAGIPVNNSRVLTLHANLAANTGEGDGLEATAVIGSATTLGTGSSRTIDIYLKYVKLARVWLNNVEVEQ